MVGYILVGLYRQGIKSSSHRIEEYYRMKKDLGQREHLRSEDYIVG